jgi:mannose-6-phosphate isomerase-like protein (cupin superfamily)|tara:strand:- start:651 stop:986 length:336 start_codon:yes stop_codon:yes gene_type:complete
MRVARQWHLEGETIKNSEIYKLLDNTELNNLIVSSTTLYPSKETRGHSHEDQEEVYMFTRGEGTITIHDHSYPCKAGDVFVIPVGKFHKVYNTHPEFALHFMCVFEGKRNH